MSPPLLPLRGRAPGVGDDELLVRAGRGDLAAFAALVDRHQGAVYRYCWRVFRNHHTAEDLAQDFFLKLHRVAPRYHPEGHYTTYMYRVLTNLCYDALRRKRRRSKTEATQIDPVASEGTVLEPVAPPSPLDAGLVAEEHSDAVHEALAALPDEVRKAIELREFEGLRYREIARVLDLSVAEVKVLLHRGRRLLSRRLSRTAVGREWEIEEARGRGTRGRRGSDGTGAADGDGGDASR